MRDSKRTALTPLLQCCVVSTILVLAVFAAKVSSKSVQETPKPELLSWGSSIITSVKELFDNRYKKTTASATSRPKSPTLTAAQCETALSQCSMRDVILADFQATFREVNRKEIFQYKTILRQLKRTFVTLIDTVLNEPTLTTVDLSSVCGQNDDQQDENDRDDDDGLIDSNSKRGPSTPWKSRSPVTPRSTVIDASRTQRTRKTSPQSTVSPQQSGSLSTMTPPSCVVSEWSQWSGIVGFGQQQRQRVIQQASACPIGIQLIETRACTCAIRDSTGKNVFEDVKIVSENFKNDFIQTANGLPRDLLLVLDSSGSITEDDFNAMKEGVKMLIDVLCGGFGSAASNNRLSIILFSTDSVLSHRFDMDQSPELLKQAVDGLQHMSQFTCTGSALELAYEAFDPKYGSRNFTVHDTLLLTDGQSNCGSELVAASQLLQQRSNVYSLAIGLGDNVNAASEIQSVVSNQDPRHLFSLANFRDFEMMVKTIFGQHNSNNCQRIYADTSLNGQ